MVRPINEIIADLSQVGNVDEHNFEKFEMLVAEACETRSRDAIASLIDCLDDACEFDEIIFGVVHAVESFPTEEYFAVLSERFPIIVSQSPRWTSILIMRIMNVDGEFAKFLATLSDAKDETKNDVIRVMKGLSNKERFHTKCEEAIRFLS